MLTPALCTYTSRTSVSKSRSVIRLLRDLLSLVSDTMATLLIVCIALFVALALGYELTKKQSSATPKGVKELPGPRGETPAQ